MNVSFALLDWIRVKRHVVVPLLVTFVVFFLLAFQPTPQPSPAPQPSPTSLITFESQTPPVVVDGDRLWALIDRWTPYLFMGLTILFAFGRKRVDKAGVEVADAQTDVDQRQLVTRAASKTFEAVDSAERSAASAAEAARNLTEAIRITTDQATVITNLQTDLRTLTLKQGESDTTIGTLQRQNTNLQEQIVELRGQVNDWKGQSETQSVQLLEKDRAMNAKDIEHARVVALKDADIARLNGELLMRATWTMPPIVPDTSVQANTPPAGSTPLGAPGNPMEMLIRNTDDDPVPVIDKPGKTVDDHAAANAKQQARLAAAVSKGPGAPDEPAPQTTSEVDP